MNFLEVCGANLSRPTIFGLYIVETTLTDLYLNSEDLVTCKLTETDLSGIQSKVTHFSEDQE